MNRPGGVTAIAIWYLVGGLLALLSFCVLVSLPAFGIFQDVDSDAGLVALISIGLCIAIFALLDAALSLAASYGLLRMREWGRYLGIFLALFSLLAVPVGTVIGVVILWYLFEPEVKRAFEVGAGPDRTDMAIEADAAPVEEDAQETEAAAEPPIPDPLTGEEPSGEEPSEDG